MVCSLRLQCCGVTEREVQDFDHRGEKFALGKFVATIFEINDSILGAVMSKINRDK